MKDKYASRYWQRSVQGAAQPRALPRAETSVRSMYIVFTEIARDAVPSLQPHSHSALLSAHDENLPYACEPVRLMHVAAQSV